MKTIIITALVGITSSNILNACTHCDAEQGNGTSTHHKIGEMMFVPEEVPDGGDIINKTSLSDICIFEEAHRIILALYFILSEDEYKKVLNGYILHLPVASGDSENKYLRVPLPLTEYLEDETIQDVRSFFLDKDNLTSVENTYGKGGKERLIHLLETAEMDEQACTRFCVSNKDSDYLDALAHVFNKAVQFMNAYRKMPSRFQNNETSEYYANEIPFLEMISYKVYIWNLLHPGLMNAEQKKAIFQCIKDYDENSLKNLANKTASLMGTCCTKRKLRYFKIPSDDFKKISKWNWEFIYQQFLQQIKAVDSGILGGDGLSIETAIVLTSQDNFELVRQEREIFRAVYGFSPENQSLIKRNGRYYDVWRGNGKTLYFDITSYWQHKHGAQPAAHAAPATTPVQQATDYSTPAQAEHALQAAMTRLCDTLDACTPENAEQSATTVRKSIDTIVKVRKTFQSGIFNMADLQKVFAASGAEIGKLEFRMQKSLKAFKERVGKDTTGRMKTVISPEELDEVFSMYE